MNSIGQPNLASIIIPTYNRALLLQEALASAAAQTYRPLEIIVVDDGSSDDTAEVVNHWRELLINDSEATIRYFRQSNAGVSSARNRGLIESTGDFIQFLDSDDILNSGKLSLHIDCLKRYPECGYVFSDWATLESPMKWAPVSVNEAADMNSAELYCSPRVKWTMVGAYRRKTCYEAGPYREDMVTGEDKEFNLRALLATDRVVYLPGSLCASRDHSSSRITDLLKVGDNGLIFAVGLHRHMTESAAADARLNNPRLVSALVKGLSGIIIGALEAGRRDLANDAIGICRKMPVGFGRHVRLAIYQILSLLPRGVFPRFWRIWLKIRRAVFEIPNRKLRRLDKSIRSGKPKSMMRRSIHSTAKLLPPDVKRRLQSLVAVLRSYRYECPLCRRRVESFLPLSQAMPGLIAELKKHNFDMQLFAQAETLNLQQYACPYCRSNDRTRMYALFLRDEAQKIGSESKLRMLDIAPARTLREMILKLGCFDYRSADLLRTDVDDHVDIMDMKAYANDSFDCFICSHVLEHVPDDRLAIGELFRILKPGGWGIAMAPIILGLRETIEDPNLSNPDERFRRFGQGDHLRLYARHDFIQRLTQAGFKVSGLGFTHFGGEILERNGIQQGAVLYICRKLSNVQREDTKTP